MGTPLERYDAVVIGGGPAGAATATVLARLGRRVAVLEQERFPRFHVGESLLPCSTPLFEELGVLASMKERFLEKHAAEFVLADGSLERRYAFGEGLIPGAGSAFEVERAELDQLLLDNARASGAEIFQETRATAFELEDSGVRVTARGPDGASRDLSAEVLVDAGGQGALVPSRLGLKTMDPTLKNFSLFRHVEGAERHSGEREGDISIVLDGRFWWWLIPLRHEKTSVGVVGPIAALEGRKPDAAFFEKRIRAAPYLARRLSPARALTEVQSARDWSYQSSRLAGERWLLVGDAACFIDPVFSTGVHLGIAGAFRAAQAIDQALREPRTRRALFREYQRWLRRGIVAYRGFARGFYDRAFVELLLQPSDFLELRRGITSLLAGHGLESPSIVRRARVFRVLARVQGRMTLVPRLPAGA